MSIDFVDKSVMILDAGFHYSSEDISQSLYRAFERKCGSENIFQFKTQAGLDFCNKVLTTYNVYNEKGDPTAQDIKQLLCDPILRYAVQTQVDYIIAVHGFNINTEIIDCLKLACPNTKTICWCVDDPQQIDVSHDYASHYDYTFTNEKNCVVIHGKDRAWHLETAYDDEIFNVDKDELDDEYRSDILISGSIYANRLDFIERIYEYIKDYKIKIIGKIVHPDVEFSKPGLREIYNGMIVPLDEMAKYMVGAKICLDIPRLTNISEYGRTNKNNITGSYLNPRIYETAGACSMIITSNERTQIEHSFESDECVTYTGSLDCANKLAYYLENEDDRIEIVNKAHERAKENHRYIDRVDEIFKILPEKPSNAKITGLRLGKEQQNQIALGKFKDTWQRNFDKNAEFVDCGSLEEFLNTGTDRKALIVSNAPSLEHHESALNMFNRNDMFKNVDIFSVNSSYRCLKFQSIVPKYHVQIHPTEDQAKHFEGADHSGTIFLASAFLNNKVIHAWEGEKRLFAPKGLMATDFHIPEEYKDKIAIIESALVVGFTATVLAVRFGYKTIGWLGFDFSLVDNKKYAHEKCDYTEEIRHGFIVRKDMHGSPVTTNYIMLDACAYMVGLANGQEDINFYNLTNAGLLYGGRVKRSTLSDFCKLDQMGD